MSVKVETLEKNMAKLVIEVPAEELEKALQELHKAKNVSEEALAIRDNVLEKMNVLRVACDEAELLTAKKYWPFPTYSDLLFGVK